MLPLPPTCFSVRPKPKTGDEDDEPPINNTPTPQPKAVPLPGLHDIFRVYARVAAGGGGKHLSCRFTIIRSRARKCVGASGREV